MAAPTVTSVSAPTGLVAGGTQVIILGASFTGTTGVTFGGTAAADFVVIDDTDLYAVTPAHAAGLVDVAVTNADGTGTGVDLFTFEEQTQPVYKIYLFDDCCHIWISEDTGSTWVEGCTPGDSTTPPPNDPGDNPHQDIGTLLDAWSDCSMALNDGDTDTVVAVDRNYNEVYGIIGISAQGGRNQTWSLIDPMPGAPAFVTGSPEHIAAFACAASSGGQTVIVTTYTFISPIIDQYPRITRDSGATWSDVTGVQEGVTWSRVCFGSEDSQIMYLKPTGAGAGGTLNPAYLRKSTDWGVTWSALSNGPDYQDASDGAAEIRLRCSADGQTIVMMAYTGEFWVSRDGGATWDTQDFSALLVVPGEYGNYGDCGVSEDGGTIIVSMEQFINGGYWPAVFVSTDGGANFTEVTGNLQYPASVGAPAGGAPGTNATGCMQCNVSQDGLGMVVTFQYFDFGIFYPDGEEGLTLYANVSTDAGQTWKLCSYGADPYQHSSFLGFWTGIYIASPPAAPTTGHYFIERMDNRIWPTIEDAWCLDAALEYPMPTPDATLTASSGSGSQNIVLYNVINGGTGYNFPTGQILDIGGTGSGATVSLSQVGGVITSAEPVTIGSGYTHPTLTVLDSVGSGAVIQPIVTNYVTLSASANVFTTASEGSIIRMGGGKLEVVFTGITTGSTSTVIANIISPIATVIPDDPESGVIPATPGEWTMTAPTMTVSGLWHLEGMAVAALADGGVVTDLEVENGSVTLPYEATQILVGLPFVAQVQTMYLDAGAGPTVQGRRKSNPQVIVRVEGSRPMEIGTNQPDAAAQPNQATIPWTQMTEVKFRTPSIPAGQPLPLWSGDYEPTNLFGGYDTRGQIAIQQRDPVPLTVTAIIIQTTIGDDPGK